MLSLCQMIHVLKCLLFCSGKVIIIVPKSIYKKHKKKVEIVFISDFGWKILNFYFSWVETISILNIQFNRRSSDVRRQIYVLANAKPFEKKSIQCDHLFWLVYIIFHITTMSNVSSRLCSVLTKYKRVRRVKSFYIFFCVFESNSTTTLSLASRELMKILVKMLHEMMINISKNVKCVWRSVE